MGYVPTKKQRERTQRLYRREQGAESCALYEVNRLRKEFNRNPYNVSVVISLAKASEKAFRLTGAAWCHDLAVQATDVAQGLGSDFDLNEFSH